ncbi:TPA: helix-turn-helix domain-containing protein [Listeria monocytogenes]|uniref:helix-turn-helix domain-containing protein n=1 Tax=Listeria TaxID=1637 RepID=UPI001CECE5B8|nr:MULTISPECIES: helix-turn-helix domain-containing protein [Listeria]MCH4950619.1 helix-turn-helix domain-containing protein [Listeria monocytogenes]MDA5749157.1 helix-turn-helix domain-containing protein [Listeria monocytogenes]WAU21064.1 helix-turn-helix domain-containing protein [Listeria monocytogenes]WDE54922.1 helix-turn-helix domain-containing protein [Listeria monocytogenes]
MNVTQSYYIIVSTGGDYMFGDRLRSLRENKNLTQQKVADDLNIKRENLSNYERNKREPDYEMLKKLAEYYGVSRSYILGETDKKHYWELNDKDERSIQKDLQKMIDDLSNSDAFAYSKEDGEMDENTKKLLIMSLENSLRIAKEESKKRFTPKKYRK